MRVAQLSLCYQMLPQPPWWPLPCPQASQRVLPKPVQMQGVLCATDVGHVRAQGVAAHQAVRIGGEQQVPGILPFEEQRGWLGTVAPGQGRPVPCRERLNPGRLGNPPVIAPQSPSPGYQRRGAPH